MKARGRWTAKGRAPLDVGVPRPAPWPDGTLNSGRLARADQASKDTGIAWAWRDRHAHGDQRSSDATPEPCPALRVFRRCVGILYHLGVRLCGRVNGMIRLGLWAVEKPDPVPDHLGDPAARTVLGLV